MTDELDQILGQEKKNQVVPKSDFDLIMEDEARKQQERARIESAGRMAVSTTPADTAARVQIGTRVGVSPGLLADPKIRADYERMAKVLDFPVERLMGTKTGSWATQDPDNAAVAQTSFDPMLAIEGKHGAIEEHKKAVAEQNQKNGVGWFKGLMNDWGIGANTLMTIPGDLAEMGVGLVGSPETVKNFQFWRKYVAPGMPGYAGDFARADTAGRENINYLKSGPQRVREDLLVRDPKTGEEFFNWGAISLESVAGIVAQEMPAFVAAAALAPESGGVSLAPYLAKFGRAGKAVTSLVKYATKAPAILETVRTATADYNDGKQLLMAQGLTEEQAAIKAAPGGLLAGLFSSIAGSPMEAKVFEDLLEKVAKVPGGFGIANQLRARGKALLSMGAKEGAQEVVQGMGEDLAKWMTFQPDLTIKQAGANAIMNFVGGFAMGGPSGAVALGSKSIGEAQGRDFMNSIHEGAQNSEAYKLMPAKWQEFVSHLTKDGPIENIGMPVTEWNTFWQQQGVDPAAKAVELGVSPTEYQQALQLKGDLQIKTAEFATKIAGTEAFGELSKDIRYEQGAPTEREAAVQQKQLAEDTKAILEKFKAEPESAVMQQAETIKQQLIAAGRPETEASAEATLYQKFIATIAAREGMDPSAMADRFKLTVHNGKAMVEPAGQPASQGYRFRQGGQNPVAVDAVHYSPVQGLTALDPSFSGQGTKGAEAKRLAQLDPGDPLRQRVYLYPTKDGTAPKPEGLVTGKNIYQAKLDNLYDLQADPEGLRANAADANAMERAIVNAGYDGYLSPRPGENGSVVLLGTGQVPVAPFAGEALYQNISNRDLLRTSRQVIGGLDKNTFAEFKKSLKEQMGPDYTKIVRSLEFGGETGDKALRKAYEKAQEKEMPGAPSTVRNEADRQVLLDQMIEMAKQGEAGRFWYDDSARAFLQLAGGDRLQAFKLATLTALYSPQTGVADNGRRAILAYYDAMHNMAVSAGGVHPNVKELAQRVMSAKTMEDVQAVMSGQKTSAFQQNLLNLFAPEHANDDSATIDLHMMRAFGYDTEAPTPVQYKWAEQLTRDVADELGWGSPKEAQAAIWVAQKMKTDNKGKGSEAGQAGFHYGDAARKIAGGVNVEAMPGSDVVRSIFPGIGKATRPQLEQYHAEKMAIVRQALEKAGVMVAGENTGHGYWEGVSNPVTSFLIPLPHIGSEGGHNMAPSAQAEIERAAKVVLDLVGDQDAIGWNKPFATTSVGEANATHYALERALTVEEMKHLGDEFSKAGLDAFIDASDPKNLKIINYNWDGTTNGEKGAAASKLAKAYHGKLNDVIINALPDGLAAEAHLFNAQSGLVSKEATNAGETEGRGLPATGSPAVQAGNDAGGRAQIEALNERFRQEYGWGTTDPNDRGTRGQAQGVGQTLYQGAESLKPVDTNSPEFKQWFGSSKVVDKSGNPLVLHHGTDAASIEAFRPGGVQSLGVHLGSIEQARKMGNQVLDLYATIQNPLRLEDARDWRPSSVIPQLQKLGYDVPPGVKTAKQLRALIESLGFDGVVYLNRYEGIASDAFNDSDHDWKYGPKAMSDRRFKAKFPGAKDSWIAFSPSQIKSATSNVGTFDINDVRILHQSESFKPVDTGSPEFRSWFGESKIVDENGEPKRFYHGTLNEFGSFNRGQHGIFFTDRPEFSSAYSGNSKDSRVMPVYLKAENTFDFENPQHIADYIAWGGKEANAVRAGDFSAIEYGDVQKFIKENGYDSYYTSEDYNGETYKNIAVFDPSQVKSAISNTGSFDPNNPSILHQPDGLDRKRGFLQIGPDHTFNLGVLEKANVSTVAHELGHFYLEVMRDIASQPGASEQTKADFETILKHYGDNGEVTRDTHERFADAHLLYLQEGNAPAEELRPVFQRFSRWLTRIWQTVKSGMVDVKLNPEVRGVFERLYASDQEIESAKHDLGRPLFATAEAAGMTEAEFKLYTETESKRITDGNEKLVQKLMVEMERERTKERRDLYNETKDRITQEVLSRPEYQALMALVEGKTAEGIEVKLSREALVERGVDPLSLAKDGIRVVYTSEGGMDAETAAMFLGYQSGDALIQALTGLESRVSVIERLTQDEVHHKFPDTTQDPAALRQAAIEALSDSKNAERVLALELKAINQKRREVAPAVKLATNTLKAEAKDQAKARSAGEKAQAQAAREAARNDRQVANAAAELPNMQAFRQAAGQMVQDMKAYELNPYRYLQAQRKAANEAFKAMAKNDYEGASEAKEREILNHFLYLESSKARDAVEKFDAFDRRFDKSQTREKIGKARGSYLEQIDTLRARFGLALGLGIPEPRTETLATWAAANEFSEIDDRLLDESWTKSHQDMTVSELNLVWDALKNIKTLAYQEFTILKEGKRIELEQVENELVGSIDQFNKRTPVPLSGTKEDAKAKTINTLRGFDATLVKIEAMVNWMDGGKVDGPAHRYLWDPLVKAQTLRYDMTVKLAAPLQEAFRQMPEAQRKTLTDTFSVDGFDQPLTRAQIISMLFNLGNEQNTEKLLKGYNWTHGQVMDAVGRLNAQDAAFVQSTWDTIASLWPEMVALEKRYTGVEPKKVETSPFTLYDNQGKVIAEMQGGYWPLKYDPNGTTNVGKKQQGKGLLEEGFSRPGTSRSAVKERTRFTGEILLDFQYVLQQHLNDVIMDISHREALNDVDKVLQRPGVKKAIQEAFGPEYYNQFNPWLKSIAGDSATASALGLSVWNRAFMGLRSNTIAAVLGFKFTSTIVQVADVLRVIAPGDYSVKPHRFADAFLQFIGSPKATLAQIHELSGEMRHRAENLDRDIHATLQQMTGQQSLKDRWNRAAFKGLAFMDAIVSGPAWLGAYQQAMAEHGDSNRAVAEADRVVRMKLMSGNPKDLIGAQRNNEMMKMVTMFLGDASAQYNMMRNAGHKVDSIKNIPQFTMAAAVVMAGAIIGDLLKGAGPGEDDDKLKWTLRKATLAPFETVPVLRDGAKALDAKLNNKPFSDYQLTPAIAGVTKVIGAIDATADLLGSENPPETIDWAVKAGEGIGYAFGIGGTAQAAGAVKYLRRVDKGEETPANAAEAIYFTVQGKPKKGTR